MSERRLTLTSDRQWFALLKAVRAGIHKIPEAEAKHVRRFLDMHDDMELLDSVYHDDCG